MTSRGWAYGDCGYGITEAGWEHGEALPVRELPPGLPGEGCER